MRYMGGKVRIGPELVEIMMKVRKPDQWYVEPFCGGMNVMQHVTGNRIANDIHPNLMQMWHYLLNKGWFPDKLTRKEFMHIKYNQQQYPPHILGWAGFGCAYRGGYFGGFAGEVNIGGKNYHDYQQENLNVLAIQIPKLKGVKLANTSYFNLPIPPNSLIYCDPPYENTDGYAADIDHGFFWKWVRKMSDKGHTLFVSEYNAPNDFDCVLSGIVTNKMGLQEQDEDEEANTAEEKLFIYKG